MTPEKVIEAAREKWPDATHFNLFSEDSYHEAPDGVEVIREASLRVAKSTGWFSEVVYFNKTMPSLPELLSKIQEAE